MIPRFAGDENMARDAALLCEPGLALRVYGWTEPWVTLGQFQNPERDILPSANLPWTMRPTGGKAVLHGHDVTVGLSAPLAMLGVGPRDVKSAYRAIIEPLISAMKASGIECDLGENTRFSGKGPRTADCFAHVSANDIVDPSTGLKVCGCALRMTDKAVLVQASIPNGPPLVDPALVFAAPGPMAMRHWDDSAFSDTLFNALAGTWGRDFLIMKS